MKGGTDAQLADALFHFIAGMALTEGRTVSDGCVEFKEKFWQYTMASTHVSCCPTDFHFFDADSSFVQKSISRFKIRKEKKRKEQAKLTRTAIMIRIAIILTLSGRLVNHSKHSGFQI